MMAVLDSDGQLKTIERDGDTDKACQKPAVQQVTTDDDDDWIYGIYYCVCVS